MAYNNFYPNTYQAYPQYPIQPNAYPTQMSVGATQPTQPQPNTDIKWVQGETAAKSYPVAPNTSVTLWDQESQTIYVKSADMTGMQNMKILDYTMRDGTPQKKTVLSESDFAKQSDVDYLKEQIIALRAKFDDMEGKEKKK